ncbi:hypothetical protein B7463_g7298, partial [Scytalidium lignicola]
MYPAMTSPWANIPPPPGVQGPFNTYQSTPAYHSVQVRQNFNPPPLQYTQLPPTVRTPPTATRACRAPQERKKISWPQPVRNYVQRSFDPSNMFPDVQKPEMEAKLKQTITAATENGALETIDWDNLPLPQQMIRQERAAAVAAAATASWQQESVNLHVGGSSYNNPAPEVKPRKRKSQDMDGANDADTITPPWRTTNNRNGFEDRITFQPSATKDRFEKRQQPFQEEKSTSKFQKNLEKRQKRFDGGYKSTYQASPEPEPSSGPVVGTCEILEKKYFRLTSAPIPSQVRPERILRQTLDLLKKKWKKDGNYSYICDQFKSLRQDLTVQRIRNEFTVTVYEIHARIALEKGDLGEYNQCQTQLRALYAQNLGGNPVEFKAYRILYFIHTCNRTALNDVLADLTTAEKEAPAIKHALDVRSTLALGNYHKFFRLYLDTPNMGAYLMDMFVERERLAALANMCRAYKPDVKLRFVTEELGFESDADAAQFIFDHNGQHLLEEREDGIRFYTGKAGLLFETAKNGAFRKVDIKGQI